MPSLSLRRITTKSLHATMAYIHGMCTACVGYISKSILAIDPGEHAAQPGEDATAFEVERLKDVVKQLESALEDSQSETEALRAKHDRTIQKYNKTLKDMKDQEGILQKQLSDVTQYGFEMQDKAHNANVENTRLRQSYDQHIAALNARVHQAESHATALHRALSTANDDRRKTVALLEIRTAELHDAQVFLTKVDEVTETEVLHLLNGLNSRIFQTASSITDKFESRFGDQEDSSVAESASSRLIVSQTVTPHVAQALCSVNHETDSILAATALQAAMITYAHWLCSTWDFSSSRDAVTYNMIYAQIKERGKSSSSGT